MTWYCGSPSWTKRAKALSRFAPSFSTCSSMRTTSPGMYSRSSLNRCSSPRSRDVPSGGGVGGSRSEVIPCEHPFGLALQLPDPLAGDTYLLAELGQGSRLPVVEPVAPDQYMTVPLRECIHGLTKPLGLHSPHHGANGIGGPLVLDQLPQLRTIRIRGEGTVEAGGIGHGALDVAHLLYGPAQSPGHLLVSGLTLELGQETIVGAGHLADLVPHMHGNADGAALVSNCSLHSLTDPPRSIRREPESPLRIKLLYGPHQTYVALLDEVLER